MLDFESAEDRLLMVPCEGVCPFMSPFYFTKKEAMALGKLLMPDTKDLLTTIQHLQDQKVSEGSFEVCTSHDIAPVLMIAFTTKKGFNKQDAFKKEKKKWVKTQQKRLKTEK